MPKLVNPIEVADPEELLRLACARSCVVEFHRQIGPSALPAARARMIRIQDGSIFLDTPQVIGRELPLGLGQSVDIFFQLDDELYKFTTVLRRVNIPMKLNATKSIRGAQIDMPRVIVRGQRRQFFRTSLALIEPIPIAIHLTDSANPTATPITARPMSGIILDASPGGFGVRIDNVIYSRFRIYDHYFLSFHVPGERAPAVLLAELRQSREIRDGESTKLGFLTTAWPDQRTVDRLIQPLQKHLIDLQRRNRRAS